MHQNIRNLGQPLSNVKAHVGGDIMPFGDLDPRVDFHMKFDVVLQPGLPKHFSTPRTPGTSSAATRICRINSADGIVSIKSSEVSRSTRHPV
jgi:hypothetical protein